MRKRYSRYRNSRRRFQRRPRGAKRAFSLKRRIRRANRVTRRVTSRKISKWWRRGAAVHGVATLPWTNSSVATNLTYYNTYTFALNDFLTVTEQNYFLAKYDYYKVNCIVQQFKFSPQAQYADDNKGAVLQAPRGPAQFYWCIERNVFPVSPSEFAIVANSTNRAMNAVGKKTFKLRPSLNQALVTSDGTTTNALVGAQPKFNNWVSTLYPTLKHMGCYIYMPIQQQAGLTYEYRAKLYYTFKTRG